MMRSHCGSGHSLPPPLYNPAETAAPNEPNSRCNGGGTTGGPTLGTAAAAAAEVGVNGLVATPVADADADEMDDKVGTGSNGRNTSCHMRIIPVEWPVTMRFDA